MTRFLGMGEEWSHEFAKPPTYSAEEKAKRDRKLAKKFKKQLRLFDRIEKAFDADALIRICTMREDEFSQYGERYAVAQAAPNDFFFYRDNGAKILAIAHLDSVEQNNTCTIVDTQDGKLALSGALDDRLGAYVILELLPKLGIVCDVLLTTGEETARSTAAYFDTDKKYNWMFQFDRGGSDVVMYDYETSELRTMVREVDARVGNGSFSDICKLEHLGISGFNWGVGYQDYHGPRGHAWLNDTFDMVRSFIQFHRKWEHTPLPYTPMTRNYSSNKYGYSVTTRNATSRLSFDEELARARGLDYEGFKDPLDEFNAEEEESCPMCETWLVFGFCETCRTQWSVDSDDTRRALDGLDDEALGIVGDLKRGAE